MLGTHLVEGQGIDQKKMDKDLEVAKNVLGTMMDKSSGVRFFPQKSQIDAKYVDGSGVLFTVNSNTFRLANNQYVIGYTEAARTARGSGVSVIGRRNSQDAKEEADAKAEKAAKEKADAKVAATAPEAIYLEEASAKEKAQTEVFRDFLKDYGSLIRQLKSSDKVIIKTSNRRGGLGNAVIAGMHSLRSINSVTVEVSKQDLSLWESGKISESDIDSRINVIESVTDLEKEPEIEVFSSVLGRLFQSDLSDTYYMSGSPQYERTEGMGLTYYMKFYSSYGGENSFFLPTVERSDVDLEERNKIVNDLYPKFLEDFKESVLDYGHLLKNLEDNESVTFNIQLTECNGCDMPEEIDVMIKKSVIDQFRNDQVNLSQAMKEVKVTIVK